eukprot:6490874-Amphidinium_carterae.1
MQAPISTSPLIDPMQRADPWANHISTRLSTASEIISSAPSTGSPPGLSHVSGISGLANAFALAPPSVVLQS